MRLIWTIFLSVPLLILCFGRVSIAQSAEEQQKALAAITDAADRICASVPIEGSGTNVQLTGEAKAKLDGVVKKIADLGIEGAGKYESEEYKGLLRQDLAAGLKSNSDCKLTVLKVLQEKMIK
jgi:hypothetical protein